MFSACQDQAKPNDDQKSASASNGDPEKAQKQTKPNPDQVIRVLQKFLNKSSSSTFRVWITTGSETHLMSGTVSQNEWEIRGKKNEMPVTLSGRSNEVNWTSGDETGTTKSKHVGLYSPRAHIQQLLQKPIQNVKHIPGNRFETKYTIVQISPPPNQIEEALRSMLGEQFATPDLIKNVAQKMDVRYTVWYHKKTLGLHQLKVTLRKKGDDGLKTHPVQELLYLFEETTR